MIMRGLTHALSPGGAERARLSILIFHRVLALPDPLFPQAMDVRRFQQVMGWVRRWFEVLPLDQAVRQLHAGTLPARALCITFDDGYADNASQALPVLRHYGLPATFFIASGFLDGGRMWNDSVIEALRRTHHVQLELGALLPGGGQARLALHTLAERRRAIDLLLARIKYLPPAERQQVVARVVEAAGVPLPNHLMLRCEQLCLLRDAGMQIGAHTVSHPILQRCTDVQARWEMVHGKRMLEDLVEVPVTLFAYPNGKPGVDYGTRHVAMARAAGFVAAVSTASGAAASGGDLLQLPRFTPWQRGGLRFGLRMLGNLRRRGAVV
jgi:peptidoglycan/xylan/chitin deacetylase (PgdA/CDA1 family)